MNERIERTVCELSSIISNIATACFLSLSTLLLLYICSYRKYIVIVSIYMFFVVVVFLFRFDIFVVISFTVAKKFFFLSVSIYKYIYTLNISLFHNVRIVEFIRCVFRFFLLLLLYVITLFERKEKRELYTNICSQIRWSCISYCNE